MRFIAIALYWNVALRGIGSAARSAAWFLLLIAFALSGCTRRDNEPSAAQTSSPNVGAIGRVRQALCGASECSIDGACYAEGASNPSNQCDVCRAATAAEAWTRRETAPCEAGLHGDYFANSELSGAPVISRTDPFISGFDWSPGAPLGSENFSVRWTGQIAADFTESFTFVLQADDEAELWIDGVSVVRSFGRANALGTVDLVAGVRYDFKLEYHQRTGSAVTDLRWFSASVPFEVVPTHSLYAAAQTCSNCDDAVACTSDLCSLAGECTHPQSPNGASCSGGICQAGTCCTGCDDGDPCTTDLCVVGGGCEHPSVPNGVACNGGTCQQGACCTAGDSCMAGLHGDYFANSDFNGTPAFSRIDPYISGWFWSPGPPLGSENFSVRWTGQIAADVTEPFEFVLQADHDARLWIDGVLVVEASNGGTGTTSAGTFNFVAGVRYDFKLEFRQTTGAAITELTWHSASFSVPWQIVPTRNLFAAALPCTNCDDGNPCTSNRCTITGECAHPPNPDGVACGAGICQAGTCCTGCDDGDPCTTDLCVEGGGCTHPPAPNGLTCNGGTCQTGACCTEGESCTAGLHGDYFANSDLSGTPALSRIDPSIAFFFWSPLSSESFSVRWTGQIVADVTEPFTFIIGPSPGARLWINCKLVVETATEGEASGVINLVQGVRYDIRYEYRQTTPEPTVRLKWHSESFSVPHQVIPSSNLYAAAAPCACDDANASTEERCTRSGECTHVTEPDSPCNGGACLAGECVNTCNDGNPCTVDVCNGSGGPTHTPVPAGTPCPNGNACDGAETCNANGTCISGTAPLLTDNNPCTADACDPAGGITHTALANGSSCTDGNACNGAETCTDGACAAGAPPVVDDGNPCTADSCDLALGVLHSPVGAGTPCSDGNACNGVETCSASGTCSSGTPPPTDDGNPCTTDSCDPGTGVHHVPAAPGTACGGGADPCSGGAACDASGACVPGTPTTVDDGNPCTIDECQSGSATHTPVAAGTPCEDANQCNGHETCNASGGCVASARPVLNDNNPCTIDRCDETRGVYHYSAPPGANCADANPCNGREICDGQGACMAGTPLVLDDANACTIDTCDPSTGVRRVLAPAGTSCSNQNVCDGVETCDAIGMCVHGQPLALDDGNPCTADLCDPLTGVLHAHLAAGSSCSDEDVCNGDETCDGAGSCRPGVAPTLDDNNPCTVDSCTAGFGIAHRPVAVGTTCSDGDLCNGEEKCGATGTCLSGPPPVVDDGNPCTVDSCAATGVTHVLVTPETPCNDGDACNGAERCDALGVCMPGMPPVLDDGDPCTADTCDAVAGVRHDALAEGSFCSSGNGNRCASSGNCEAGACVIRAPAPDTDDGNPCTSDACDSATGLVTHSAIAVGGPCDDRDPCTSGETCNAAGLCTGGTAAATVDDGNPCTDDTCSSPGGALHSRKPAGTTCGVGKTCDADGNCISGVSNACRAVCGDAGQEGRCLVTCEGLPCKDRVDVFASCLATGGDCASQRAAYASCVDHCGAAALSTNGVYQALTTGSTSCYDAACDPDVGPAGPLPEGTTCALLDVCSGVGRCDGAGNCIVVGPTAPNGTPCTALSPSDNSNPFDPGALEPFWAPGLCQQGSCQLGGATCVAVEEAPGEIVVTPVVPEGFGCGDPACSCSTEGGPCVSAGYSPCGANPCLDPESLVARKGDACTLGACLNGTCDELGHCIPTPDPSLDDGKACTLDVCDANGAALHSLLTPSAGSLDDGDDCTLDDCDADGNVVHLSIGPPGQTLSDGNDCTIDACVPPGTVTHEPVPAGTECSQGICTADGTCVSTEGLCNQVAVAGNCDTYTDVGACKIKLAVLAEPKDDGDTGCVGELSALVACAESGNAAVECIAGSFPPAQRSWPNMLLPYRVHGCEAPMTSFLTCAYGPPPNPPVDCTEAIASPEGYIAKFKAGSCVDGVPGVCVQLSGQFAALGNILPGIHCATCGQLCSGGDSGETACSVSPTETSLGACQCEQLSNTEGCEAEFAAFVGCAAPYGALGSLLQCAPNDLLGFVVPNCDAERQALLTCAGSCDDANPCTQDTCGPQIPTRHVPIPAGTPCGIADSNFETGTCNDQGACQGCPAICRALDVAGCFERTQEDCESDCVDTFQGVFPDSGTFAGCAPGVVDAFLNCAGGNPAITCLPDGPLGYLVRGCESEQSALVACGTPDCQRLDDGNPCTNDVCNDDGPHHDPVPNGFPCEIACQFSGTCHNGVCGELQPLATLDDGNRCTADLCSWDGNSVEHVPVFQGTTCSDGNPCNGIEFCNGAGACIATSLAPPDDGNPCTTEVCDPSTGFTPIFVALHGSCADTNVCDGDEQCNGAGVCLPGTVPVIDDGNACTVDRCDPTSGIVHELSLDDGDGCTVDTCDPVTGIHHTLGVDDGNPCTTDSCKTGPTGRAPAHDPVATDDGNPCTADSCDPASGVHHAPLAAGASCSDGNPCNGQESCTAAAACVATTAPPTIDDGNPCTLDTCTPQSGVRHEAAPGGAACGDGNACNGAETCDGTGHCAAGVAAPLDDDNGCTNDRCDPVFGVIHEWSHDPPCDGERSSWKQLVSAPSPRDSAAVGFDPDTNSVVVFGGENAGVALADTWTLDRAANAWRVSYRGGPPARAGAAIAYDEQRKRLVLFGGVRGVGMLASYLNDVWELDVATGTWDRRTAGAPTGPAGRAYPAMAYDSARSRVVLFGGTSAADLSDTWEWDPVSGNWTAVTVSTAPSARGGGALVFDKAGGKAILFGGGPLATLGAAPPLGDTWEFDPVAHTWTAVSVTPSPPPRNGHSMTYDALRARVILFGGTSVDAPNLRDTWEYNPSGHVWAQIQTQGTPPGRTGHVLAFDAVAKRAVLLGGLAFSETGRFTPAFDDRWEYDGVAGSWLQWTQDAAPLSFENGVAYDSDRRLIVAQSAARRVGDQDPHPRTWELDVASGRWAAKSAANNPADFGAELAARTPIGADALVYSPTNHRTVFVASSSGVAPPIWQWEGSSWTKAASSGMNFGLRASAAAFDPSANLVWAFGGDRDGGTSPFAPPTSDLWRLDLGTLHWSSLPASVAPQPRTDAAMAWDSSRQVLVLVGGRAASDSATLGDTWQWSPATSRWTRIDGAGPPARKNAAIVYDAERHRIVLFGGVAGTTLLSDTWLYDPATSHWGAVTPAQAPSPRFSAAMTFDTNRRRVVLAGGLTSFRDSEFNIGPRVADIWEWDGSAWAPRQSSATPEARSGASAAWDATRHQGLMFGGVKGDGQRAFLGDTWIWQGAWVLAGPGTAPRAPLLLRDGFASPPARTGHALAVDDGGSGLLYGGESDTGLLNDVWRFNPNTSEWTSLPPGRARTEHAMTATPGGFLMFGGRLADGSASNELAIFSGTFFNSRSTPGPSARWGHALATDTARKKVVLFGGRDKDHVFDDTWEYDFSTGAGNGTWARVSALRSPRGRFGHKLVYDSQRSRVVLIGGLGARAGETFGETWEYDPTRTSWIVRDPETPLERRAGSAAFYDDLAGQVVTFGGLAHNDDGTAAITYGDTWAFKGNGVDGTLGRLPNGTRCSAATDCDSGLCADGFCCNAPCGGQCAACNVPGSEGTCVAVSGAPHGTRSACGGTGADCDLTCNGVDSTACRRASAGASCGHSGCFEGKIYTAGACDGSGHCGGGTVVTSCEPYGCNASGCLSGCVQNADCSPGPFFCARPPWGLGRCAQYATFASVTSSPAAPTVETPIVVTAVPSGATTFVVTFSYVGPGGQRIYPCQGTGGLGCEWQPDQPGTYQFRAQIRSSLSPNLYDDQRELTIEVAP